MKIITADKVRQIDSECEKNGLPTSVLMENAGRAVAEEVRRVLGDINNRKIVVLAGPGNNGGDGLVAARYLHDRGAKTSIFIFKQRPEDDKNFRLVVEKNIPCLQITGKDDLQRLGEDLVASDAVIDAIFGIGNNRPLGDIYAETLRRVALIKSSNPGMHIFALDIPSGMNADTGAVDPACLNADDTITLGFPKTGLYSPLGLENSGKITVVDIGIPPYLAEDVRVELIDAELARSLLPRRPLGANKGTFGKVMVIAGSINYTGAAYLACSGAMRAGAGLVTLATARSVQPIVASKLSEATYLPLPESEDGVISPQAVDVIAKEIGDYDVVLIGCGLGQKEPVKEFIKTLLLEGKTGLPKLVLDADALNTLAGVKEWWKRLTGDAILTPHLGEMSRLAGVSLGDVKADWMETAGRAARNWNKTVVLKGAYTVVASPDGCYYIKQAANPGLATAGTGDVLAGTIAGLVAQGLHLEDAAACGVYLHGEAGEFISDIMGDAGMVASDLLPALPMAIKQLKENRKG